MSLEKNKYKIFGRLRGRKKKLPLDNYKNFLLKSSINLDSSNYNILDIGSGSGESSIYLANKNPFAKILFKSILEKHLCKNDNFYNFNHFPQSTFAKMLF